MSVAHDKLIFAVILTHNHYEDTFECLQSLFRSNLIPSQVVLTDNCSSDGTPDKVRNDFPGVHVIENQQNLGVAGGYNVGIRHSLSAGAEYILILNNDTILDAGMITDLMHVGDADPSTGMVMPTIYYYGSNELVWSRGGYYRRFPPSITLSHEAKPGRGTMYKIEYAPSCGLLIHRRAFEQAGFFDSGYFYWYDDMDFSERVRAAGLNIWYAPEAIMWHKVSLSMPGRTSKTFWRIYGASITRFYRRYRKPAWWSIFIHVGFAMFNEFIWKRHWRFFPYFGKGIFDELSKPLENFSTS